MTCVSMSYDDVFGMYTCMVKSSNVVLTLSPLVVGM